MKALELTGQHFGELTVIKRVASSRNGRSQWLCSCSCGSETIKLGKHLTRSKQPIRSCGCKQIKRGKDHHQWTGCGDISGDWWSTRVMRSQKDKKSRKALEISITIKDEYHSYVNFHSWEDNRHLLGEFNEVNVDSDRVVLNCFTQLNYGYDGNKYVNYDAIYDCFQAISGFYSEVAIPRIGCGLAGGNWDIVKRIINDATGDKCKVYAYYLEEK